MKTVLTINDLDFLPFLAEDGIQYNQENRLERSVITLNGRLHKKEKRSFSMSVTCLAVTDEALSMMLGALSVSPAQVLFVERETQSIWSGLYYVDGISYTESQMMDHGTVIKELTFTLTPRL